MDEKEKAIFEQIPCPPSGAVFRPEKVETVIQPHPFTITSRHVVIAADQFGGLLSEAALEAAHKQRVFCGYPNCTLPHSKHESLLTLFVHVDRKINRLSDIPGLHEYILSIKEKAESLGIKGFAFPC